MAQSRIIRRWRQYMPKGKLWVLCLYGVVGGLFCFIISCAGIDIPKKIEMPKDISKIEAQSADPLKMPEFVPAHEEPSLLKTKRVDISARNTPLRDILYVISESIGINIIMEKGVNPEVPVTVVLKNIPAGDALNIVLSAVDYFYAVKNNSLFVSATETRIFEIGFPSVLQTYSSDVGGDMLGSGTSTTTTGATTTTGTTTSGGGTTGTTSIKGNVSQRVDIDKSAYNFWEIIDKSISQILQITAGTSMPATVTPSLQPATQQAGAPTTTPPAQPSPAPQTSATIGGIAQSYTINKLTGTIMVTATKRTMGKVEQYINVVKKVINRQVLVEAKIIEVNLSDSLKFGIDWNFISSFDSRRTGSFSTTGFSTVVAATGPMFSIATTAADVTSLLNALQQQGDIRILSNPRVNIMNGQTSLLSVGQNTNFISRVITTTTSGTPPTTSYSVETSNILSGVMIGIVPYINESGEISMTITPIISDMVSLETRTMGSGAVEIQLPTVNLRELSTTVKVRNGQMVVIGGLISSREEMIDNQVPLLGDIPFLGYLFKSRSRVLRKNELVIILQPQIVSR